MMAHTRYRATLSLASPLGTPLAGDTLFGQLCWALREAQGEAELVRRLDGYTTGHPWLVVSDGFPAGHLPRPTLPQHFFPSQADVALRKAARKRRWLPLADASRPLASAGKNDTEAYGQAPRPAVQSHNTINRHTGTTGEGEFAPYTQPLTYHAASQAVDLWLIADDERLTAEELRTLLVAVGATGFGRDASIGLGKFTVQTVEQAELPAPVSPTAWWTLAPCAPQGQGFDGKQSYWRVLTRFGRHGNAHALSGKPFKTPLLLATTGAVFTPQGDFASRLFIGQGLGGNGQISKAEPATVHQGYAPALPIKMEAAPR
jgi:CRISPR-associated protein Csm4